MMRLYHRLRFFLWFAWGDLFRGHAWPTTVAVAVTNGLLLGLVLLIYGVAVGYREAYLRAYKNNPLARCLWLEDRNPGRMPPARVAQARAAVEQPGVAFYPFRQKEWQFERPGRPGQEQLRGRTLAPDDPLLDGYQATGKFRTGGPFGSPQDTGIVVTETLLKRLSPDRDPPPVPPVLSFFLENGVKPKTARVVGVLTEALPLGHQFVVTEAYETELLAENELAAEVRTLSIPADWRTEPLPDKLAETLDTFRLDDLGQVPYLKGHVWKFKSLDGKISRLTWGKYLDRIAEIMAADKRSPAPVGFATDFELIDAERSRAARPGYEFAGLYYDDAQQMESAETLAERDGLAVINKDTVIQIRDVMRTSEMFLRQSQVVMWVVVVVAAINMIVIQWLRIQQKLRELGMVKAIGLGWGRLALTYLTEALLIWLLLAAVGATATLAGSRELAGYLGRSDRPAVVADGPGAVTAPAARQRWYLPPAYWAAILAGAALASAASTLVGTAAPIVGSPMRSLGRD
jgi:hypothetical protein